MNDIENCPVHKWDYFQRSAFTISKTYVPVLIWLPPLRNSTIAVGAGLCRDANISAL